MTEEDRGSVLDFSDRHRASKAAGMKTEGGLRAPGHALQDWSWKRHDKSVSPWLRPGNSAGEVVKSASSLLATKRIVSILISWF